MSAMQGEGPCLWHDVGVVSDGDVFVVTGGNLDELAAPYLTDGKATSSW